ncbi:hypothetical protein ABKN59_003471 [Abortiporus biennis]
MQSSTNILHRSKSTISSFLCEWNGCNACLNSWNTLQQHVFVHASYSEMMMSKDTYQCCSYKPKHWALEAHIEDDHPDFLATGDRHQHWKEWPTCYPFKPPPTSLSLKLQPIPHKDIPTMTITCPQISKGVKRPQRNSSLQHLPTRVKKWRLHDRAEIVEEDDNELECPPLQSFLYDPGEEEYLSDVVLWSKSSLEPQQGVELSYPIIAPAPEVVQQLAVASPTPSAGYMAWLAKYQECLNLGLLDGSGDWPEGFSREGSFDIMLVE